MNKIRGKLACLLTGVPDVRAIDRCLPRVQALLEDWEPTYFAAYRVEFDRPEVREALQRACGAVTLVVVPYDATVRMLNGTAESLIANTMRMMWHEIKAGEARIRRFGNYDAVLRTRFDLFWAAQRLPHLDRLNTVVVPDQLSWPGVNDMVALATPGTFARYASIINRIDEAARQIKSGVPELVLARCLHLQGVEPVEQALRFAMYRPDIGAELSDAELESLAWIHPPSSTHKSAVLGPDEAGIRATVEAIRAAVGDDDAWPIHGDSFRIGTGFGDVETDSRDGSPFRWMGDHAYFFRRIPRSAKGATFVLHHQLSTVEIDSACVTVNGAPCVVRLHEVDAHGRPSLRAEFPQDMRARIPLDKIGLGFQGSTQPSQLDPASTDHRTLTVAAGAPSFYWDGGNRST